MAARRHYRGLTRLGRRHCADGAPDILNFFGLALKVEDPDLYEIDHLKFGSMCNGAI